MSSEQKLLRTSEQKWNAYYENITLEMNKFTENECLPDFELKFKFRENLRKPLTLKSTRKRIEEKTTCQRRGKKAKRHLLLRKTRQAFAKENQTGINAEKDQASILENQTIVTYTDDELVSIRDNMISKNTKKKYKYILTPFAVLV